jgi:hypothetical protein
VKELIRLATNAESEAVRVAAIKELFDRGYGRSVQPIHGEMTYGMSQQLADRFRGNEGNTLLRIGLHCRLRKARSHTDRMAPLTTAHLVVEIDGRALLARNETPPLGSAIKRVCNCQDPPLTPDFQG